MDELKTCLWLLTRSNGEIFDPVSNIVHVHKEARFNDDDLLDVAATQTLLHGGSVYAVDRAQMPDEGLLAAVFRY